MQFRIVKRCLLESGWLEVGDVQELPGGLGAVFVAAGYAVPVGSAPAAPVSEATDPGPTDNAEVAETRRRYRRRSG
jgi:hypothetical protein